MHKKAIVGLMGVLALTGAVLGSGIAFADDSADSGSTTDDTTNTVSSSASANASVTVSAACSFSRTSDSSGEYTGILANNASTEITGSTFTTICNDSGGYAIYAIGYGNNTLGETDLISANGSSNITSSSSPASGASYWQMKLTAATDNQPVLENGYGNYSAIPSTYTKVASYSTITDSASSGTRTGQAITAHYKAYASSTQPADTYAGAVKYTMVHPSTNIPDQPYNCSANKICYFPNAGNTVTDTMGDQSISSSTTSATLWASNFQRPGYGFAGWNTEYDGSGTFYGPNEDIEFEAGQYDGTGDHSAGLSLYAIWVESTGDLQGWTGCQTLTRTTYNSETGKLVASLSSITALTDKRDNQTYAVARLADGNCWMIENLRLEAEYTRGSYYQSLAQGYGGAFTGLADPETANFSYSTAMNKLGTTNYYGTDDSGATNIIDAASHTYGDPATNYAGYYFPRYRNSNTNLADDYSTTSANADTYAYGNYYTWTAAMANTTFYRSYNGAADTDTGSDAANTSICPSGWRLPLGASRNTINLSFSKLDYSMGGSGTTANANTDPTGAVRSKAWRSFPNNFLYSGYTDNSNINRRGSLGYYWSSSANRADYAYFLVLDSPTLNPGTNNDYKFVGFTVRCVVGS